MLWAAAGDAVTLGHAARPALAAPPVGALGGAGGGAAVGVTLELLAPLGTLAPEGLLLAVRAAHPRPGAHTRHEVTTHIVICHEPAALGVACVLLALGQTLAPGGGLHAGGGALLAAARAVTLELLTLKTRES